MRKNTLYIFLTIVICVVVASCSGTKKLKQANLSVPDEFGHGADSTSSIADRPWRDFYTDTILQNYIAVTLANNYDLLVAAAKIDELAELYGVQKANYLPSLRGLIGETRETNDYYDDKSTVDPEISFKFTLNWEIDLWGGLTYAQQQAGAKYMGSVEDRRAMQITLIAEVARAYYNLAAARIELDIVNQTLQTREQALKKAKLRFEGGLTSELVYDQARVEYATTAALVPGIQNRIVKCENALNLLMGRLPGIPLEVSPTTLEHTPDEVLPVGIPSQVLERRPDLRSSEQSLKSALADCGVAYSNQFPKLVIGITGGWENDEIKNLLRSPFSYILGNIAGTIFDFGRNRRKYKSKIAAYEQARIKYEKSVVAAFTEVDNAISTWQKSRQSAQLRREQLEVAARYAKLATLQYESGWTNYIDVLDAQRRHFEAQTVCSNAVRDEYLAMIELYKALGGGLAQPNE